MIETITFSGLIKTRDTALVELERSLEYISPNGILVSVRNDEKDADSLCVNFTFGDKSIDEAKIESEVEISRLANVLSWERGWRIIDYRITSHSTKMKDGRQSVLVMVETLKINMNMSLKTGVNEEGIKAIENTLETEYPDDFLDLLILWKEAMNQESPVTRFFLLFRILEDELGKRKAADAWIRDKMPDIELRESQGTVSVLTYLRDNIHPKKENKGFPFTQVQDNLPIIEKLVTILIKEKYPDRSS